MDVSIKQQGIKKLAPYGLVLAAVTFAGQAQAVAVDIVSLDMASTSIVVDYNSTTYNFSTSSAVSILMGEYQTTILSLDDGAGNTVTFYSTDVDANPAPSGTVDDAVLGTDGTLGALVGMDFTALRGSFTLGGDTLSEIVLWDGSTVIDSNIYDSATSAFQFGWTTDLPGSSGSGPMSLCWGCSIDSNNIVQTDLAGTVSTVPVPAALWLFGAGLIGLAGIAKRKNAA